MFFCYQILLLTYSLYCFQLAVRFYVGLAILFKWPFDLLSNWLLCNKEKQLFKWILGIRQVLLYTATADKEKGCYYSD